MISHKRPYLRSDGFAEALNEYDFSVIARVVTSVIQSNFEEIIIFPKFVLNFIVKLLSLLCTLICTSLNHYFT